MAQTIRTRKTHRDIKALDKTMTAAERMKNAYVREKDSAGQARGGEGQGSPVEYAEDRAVRWAEQTAHESTHQIKEKGGRALHYVKEKRRIAGEIKQIQSGSVEGHFSESGECPSEILADGADRKIYRKGDGKGCREVCKDHRADRKDNSQDNGAGGKERIPDGESIGKGGREIGKGGETGGESRGEVGKSRRQSRYHRSQRNDSSDKGTCYRHRCWGTSSFLTGGMTGASTM